MLETNFPKTPAESVRAFVRQAQASGRVSAEDWKAAAESFAQLPRRYGPAQRSLLDLWVDPTVNWDAESAVVAGKALSSVGFDTGATEGRRSPELLAGLLASSISSPDGEFQQLWQKTGRLTDKGLVAVVDAGAFLATHDALVDKLDLRHGRDYSGGTFHEWTSSTHGGMVAGIASRGEGVVAIPLRAVDMAETLDAIEAAVSAGAAVINLSTHFGTSPQFPSAEPLREAIRSHPETLFTIAAGNGDGWNRPLQISPSDTGNNAALMSDNAIIVAAADRAGRRAAYSNYGAGVDLGAPAHRFLAPERDEYINGSGTSSAAPYVANVAVQSRLLCPSLDAAELKTLVNASVAQSPEWGPLSRAGGILDPAQALRAGAWIELVREGETVPRAARDLGLDPGSPLRTVVEKLA